MSNKIKKAAEIGSNLTKVSTGKRRPLQEIFTGNQSLGWEVLDAESLLYSETQVTMDKITQLTTLYMKIIQKLNSLQDPRELYFTFKMQKLMSEPYIIRCFSNQTEDRPSALDGRRKKLEQTIEKEAERQNHRAIVQKTIQAQIEKEERLRATVRNAVEESNRKLEERIQKRAMNRLQRSMEYSPRSSLNNSIDISSEQSGSRIRLDIEKSSDFEMIMDQQTRFRLLKRRVEEQEQQERSSRRLDRDIGLWNRNN